MHTKHTQDELHDQTMKRYTVTLTEWQRHELHNAACRMFNKKKPKSWRDSEWAMHRASIRHLIMKLKRPDDPARIEYEKKYPAGFEL